MDRHDQHQEHDGTAGHAGRELPSPIPFPAPFSTVRMVKGPKCNWKGAGQALAALAMKAIEEEAEEATDPDIEPQPASRRRSARLRHR